MNVDEEAGIRFISLDLLKSGFPHIPSACGELHAQAASICFNHHGHASGVQVTIEGDFSESVRVEWTHEIDQPMIRYWNDLSEAVEQGAVGLAILFLHLLTGYTVVERAVKGSGVDWWLGSDKPLVQKKARLEVSGILTGNEVQLGRRVRLKVEQTKQSDSTEFEAYIVVVEFSSPKSQVVKR